MTINSSLNAEFNYSPDTNETLIWRRRQDMSLDRDHESAERIALSEILNLSEAGALAERLLAVRGSDVVIDASEVSLLGAPCAQVLASACKTWKADGRIFEMRSESDAFREGLGLLGLSETLEVGA